MADKTYNDILFSVEGGVATLALNRPKALNALYAPINEEIMDALKTVQADESIRVLILTGLPKAFAAGADVKEMAEADPETARKLASLAVEINNTLEALPIPTIAAVPGFAFGGGFEMALSCDFRIGGSRTTLAFPECGIGIIPGANGSARVAAIVGPAKAKELVMLSDPAHPITGKQAYDMGLLNWYVTGDEEVFAQAKAAKAAYKEAKKSGDEAKIAEAKAANKAADNAAAQSEFDAIMAEANKVAARLVARPGKALAAAKAVIMKVTNDTVANGKIQELDEFAALFATHDQKEGMAAMIEKREPVFTNK